MTIEKNRVKKILCIKLKGIGDVILSSIVLKNLREDFPDARIDFLTERPSEPLLRNLPLINEVLVLKKMSFTQTVRFYWDIISRNYDLVLDLYSNPRTALITYLSGARFRAGFPYRGRSYAYNLFGPVERDKFHAAPLHLELLKNIGIAHSDDSFAISLPDESEQFADNFFKEKFKPGEFVFCISPSGGWDSKKCTTEKWLDVCTSLFDLYEGKILLVWGPDDETQVDEIKRTLIDDRIIKAPFTDITRMGALMKRCGLIIANDSGPMHLAVALELPVLSIHGPTNPRFQGPYGDKNQWVRLDELDCISCNLLVCPKKKECFNDLPFSRIQHKIEKLFTAYGIDESDIKKN
ncbi:MAG: glycosyltransferase family 9 protein [Ignavibacteriaceae bacterium]|nr:glycosyltransferase family 9 protein [Ignavibacteriaceae bacterium]